MINKSFRKQHEKTMIELLKTINEKNYMHLSDVIESDEEHLKGLTEYFEQYLQDMEYETIDLYRTPCSQNVRQEIIYEHDDGKGFAVDYYLTSEGEIIGLCLNLRYRQENEKLKCTLNFDVSEPEENEYYVAGISILKNILHELHCKNYAKIETMIHKTPHCKNSELGEFLENYFGEILEEYKLNEIDEYSVYNEIEEDIDADSCTIEYQMTADSGKEIGNWMILEIQGKNKKIVLGFEKDEMFDDAVETSSNDKTPRLTDNVTRLQGTDNHSKTKEFSIDFINKINNCNFFARCGEADQFEFEVEYVNSLGKVKKHLKSLKWENTCLEAYNDFSAFMFIHSNKPIDAKEWNTLVELIKSEYLEKLSDKVKKLWIDEDTSEDVWIDFSSSMIDLFLLDYYAGYYKSEFHDQLLEIYLSGHLPCGWKGKYLQGNFIVY